MFPEWFCVVQIWAQLIKSGTVYSAWARNKYFFGGLYLSARGLILGWQVRESSRFVGVAKYRFHFSRWIKGWRER